MSVSQSLYDNTVLQLEHASAHLGQTRALVRLSSEVIEETLASPSCLEEMLVSRLRHQMKFNTELLAMQALDRRASFHWSYVHWRPDGSMTVGTSDTLLHIQNLFHEAASEWKRKYRCDYYPGRITANMGIALQEEPVLTFCYVDGRITRVFTHPEMVSGLAQE